MVVPKFVSLKNHPTLNEKWLHERLIENPSLLGLGDLDVRDSERRQPSGGRLDLLLQEVEAPIRYEVEIQLGSVDESHIIRTIEYWDIERHRYPQYEHRAVIVAEDVTSRFLNVISLLNGAIPLIAIQIKGVEVKEAFTLIATTVVDLRQMGTEEEDEGDPADRTYWQRASSDGSLAIMDNLIKMINDVAPELSLKYNKQYVGLASGGTARNFVTFRPRRDHVLTGFKIPQDEKLTAWLDETGLRVVPYDAGFGSYRVRVRQNDVEKHKEALIYFIKKAKDAYKPR